MAKNSVLTQNLQKLSTQFHFETVGTHSSEEAYTFVDFCLENVRASSNL